MCYPISLIITEDKVFLPPENVWNHSHTFIMKVHNIPDGLLGDKYLRLEVTPPDKIFRNKETNKKLAVNKKWNVIVDETNIPDWYSNDLANQEDRVREAAKKWFKDFPDNLVPGYKLIAGDCANINAGNSSTLTAGNNSTLTGGDFSKLTGGDYSTLTGGDNSTLTGGNWSRLTSGNSSTLTGGSCSTLTGGNISTLTGGSCSTLTGGDYSILTGGDYSKFYAGKNSSFSSIYWDGERNRTVTFYVGENGILPNKKYKIIEGKIYDYETNEEVKGKENIEEENH